jgi:hypothetical protein
MAVAQPPLPGVYCPIFTKETQRLRRKEAKLTDLENPEWSNSIWPRAQAPSNNKARINEAFQQRQTAMSNVDWRN